MTVVSYADYFAAGSAQEIVPVYKKISTETTTAYPGKEVLQTIGSYSVYSSVFASDGSGFSSGDNWNGTHNIDLKAQWYTDLGPKTSSPFNRGHEGVWIRFQLARTAANPDRTVQLLEQIKIWNYNYYHFKKL